jgi:non-ribosomal peptide synthetase component F
MANRKRATGRAGLSGTRAAQHYGPTSRSDKAEPGAVPRAPTAKQRMRCLVTRSVVAELQQRQSLADPNCAGSSYSPGRCLAQLFEAQVERTPLATAIEYGGSQFTYSELNRRACATH